MLYQIIAQGLGALGVTCTIIAVQFNSHFKIMFFKTLSELLFAVQLVMLGSMTGAVMNFVGIFRNVVFVLVVKKNKPITPWIALFMIITLATGITTAVLSWSVATTAMSKMFKSHAMILTAVIIVSTLPVIAKTLTTIAYALKNPHKLRMLNLPSVICWLIHDLAFVTIAGIANNVFAICSITVAEIRYKKIIMKKESEVQIEKSGSN